MTSEKALSVLGHWPVTLPVDFNFMDIEEVFEVYDYLTPDDARAVLRKRRENGCTVEDFAVQFLASFRRPPVIPDDVEEQQTEVFEVYPRANPFLVSDVVRMGTAGLYRGINGRKPFLNPWDSVPEWDKRMKSGETLETPSVSATDQPPMDVDDAASQEEPPAGHLSEAQLQADPVVFDPAVPGPSSLQAGPNPATSTSLEARESEVGRVAEAVISVGSGELAAAYNLRPRPAPFDVPARPPGLQGLGHPPARMTAKRARDKSKDHTHAVSPMKIPPLEMSFRRANPPHPAQRGEKQQSDPCDQQLAVRDSLEPVPMDEDEVLEAVHLSTSETELKDAIAHGNHVIGSEEGHTYIVKTTSIEVATQYVEKYRQILQQRSTCK